jgi:predicted transcriptional regulator
LSLWKYICRRIRKHSFHELAATTGRGTDDLVQEAVARLLAHNEWFKQQVQVGLDQIARGEFIEEEEMDARVERMLQR